MKIPFIRVREEIEVEASNEEELNQVSLKGKLKKHRGLFRFHGEMKGHLELTCDSCSKEYKSSINEELTLWFSDGEFRSSNETDDNKDVIEFFEGFIDFNEVIRSEIESIKLDYHKCEPCEQNPMED